MTENMAPDLIDELLGDMPTAADVRAEDLRDPEFRRHWGATVLARAVAIGVVSFRAEHGLTQTQLARMLGMQQPAIARLEDGERAPTIDTLMRLAEIGMGFAIDIKPAKRLDVLAGKRPARPAGAVRTKAAVVVEQAMTPKGAKVQVTVN